MITLMPGNNDYFPNNKIDISYIRTAKSGYCYKMELEKSFPFESFPFLTIMVSSNSEGDDKLTKVNLMVAGKNTWQGIIWDVWPYDHVPLKIGKDMIPGYADIYVIKLKEELWKKLEGHNEFDDCMNKFDSKQGCISMFEPQRNQNENRYENSMSHRIK